MVNVEESIVAQKMKKENSNVHIKKKVICAVHVSTFDRSKYTRGFYRVNLKIQKLKNEKKTFQDQILACKKEVSKENN